MGATVDLWALLTLTCCLGAQGEPFLCLFTQRIESCSAKKGSLVLPAHGLTACGPALRDHALVRAWPISQTGRDPLDSLDHVTHGLWLLTPFQKPPKEIPVVSGLSAQLLPAAQLLIPRHLPSLLFLAGAESNNSLILMGQLVSEGL